MEQEERLKEKFCPKCNAALPADSAMGLCPRCLLLLGQDHSGSSDVSYKAAPRPPGSSYMGNYKLLGEIAHGGMGVVYKAHDQDARRYVALKVILSGPFSKSQELQRFRREVQA